MAHITQFMRDWFPSCWLRLCRLFLRSAVVLLSPSAMTVLKTRPYLLPHSTPHDPCYAVPFPCLSRVFPNSDISGEEHSLIFLSISVAPTSVSSSGLPLLYQSLNLRAILYHISCPLSFSMSDSPPCSPSLGFPGFSSTDLTSLFFCACPAYANGKLTATSHSLLSYFRASLKDNMEN